MAADIEVPGLYLSNVVKDVIRIATGLELNEIKTFSDNYDDVTEEITGILMMSGEFNVLLSLGMSRSTASTFAVYMTGVPNAQLNDYDLNDCVAELLNMMAGQLKTQLAGLGQHYKNLPPIVVAGKEYSIIHKNKVENKNKRFRAGSIDFVLAAYYYNS